jgi:hypothetical protein
VKIDGVEQNTIERNAPFVIGNESRPRVLQWQTEPQIDRIVAEHYGYQRLKNPVIHRRTVVFNKADRSWMIEDEFDGEAVEHVFEVRFHFAPGLEVNSLGSVVEVRDPNTDLIFRVSSLNLNERVVLESQPVSRDYGQMEDAISVCWRYLGPPRKLGWKLSL